MNINVLSSFIMNEGIVSFEGYSKLFRNRLSSNMILSFTNHGFNKKNSILSISVESIYDYLFIENRSIGYGIIIILLLVIILVARSKKSSLIQVDENQLNRLVDAPSDKKLGAMIQSPNGHVLSSDLLEDKELVAIITAAIMAYMSEEEVTDGLIIRSIRKVNRRNQTNELNTY